MSEMIRYPGQTVEILAKWNEKMKTISVTQTFPNDNEQILGVESKLQKLQFWEVEVELDCPGNDLTILFEQEPLLPGIILTRNQQYIGMISRRKFFEYMSRPYGLALFSKRAIENFYNFYKPNSFIFPEDLSIVEVTQIALQRPSELVYEPILVRKNSFKYGVIDFYQLLLANSQIHILTLAQLQQVEEQARIAQTGFRDLQQNYTRLVQNEKMAALGQLVAGIAHEINNPINFIAGNLIYAINYGKNILDLISLYQQYYPHPTAEIQTVIAQIELDFLRTDFPHLLTSMEVGTKRIQEIVSSLRNFSRLDESEKKTVDIHEGIDNTLLILQSRLKNHQNGKSITVIKEYGNLPMVCCYPGLLNQVFMNILANAIDALSESFQFSVLSCDLPSSSQNAKIRICTEIMEDKQVIIRIADNGLGIPESIHKKLFDPFFTTKPVGKGTGLGLSISYQIIVEKHCGQLECISSLDQGTEFIITIPVI